MQRGVIDGFQASDPAVDITLAVHEVSKYCYLSPVRQPTDYQHLGVNTKSWEALSPGLQKLVQDAYLASGISTYAMVTKADIEAIEFLKDYGTIVGPAPKDIEDELIKQAGIFYDKKSAADPFFAKVIQSMRAWKAAYREGFARL